VVNGVVSPAGNPSAGLFFLQRRAILFFKDMHSLIKFRSKPKNAQIQIITVCYNMSALFLTLEGFVVYSTAYVTTISQHIFLIGNGQITAYVPQSLSPKSEAL
jgi:hypothetical protein